MASLKDAVQLTTQLNELTNQLHSELTEGDVDFERMVQIADEISEHADSLASAFARVNEALQEPLQENGSSSSDDSRSRKSSRREAEEPVGASS
jgi:signal recognition particle GTPase